MFVTFDVAENYVSDAEFWNYKLASFQLVSFGIDPRVMLSQISHLDLCKGFHSKFDGVISAQIKRNRDGLTIDHDVDDRKVVDDLQADAALRCRQGAQWHDSKECHPQGHDSSFQGLTTPTPGSGPLGKTHIWLWAHSNTADLINTIAHEWAHQWGTVYTEAQAAAIGNNVEAAWLADAGRLCGGL